jgi:hypothetical protein
MYAPRRRKYCDKRREGREKYDDKGEGAWVQQTDTLYIRQKLRFPTFLSNHIAFSQGHMQTHEYCSLLSNTTNVVWTSIGEVWAGAAAAAAAERPTRA